MTEAERLAEIEAAMLMRRQALQAVKRAEQRLRELKDGRDTEDHARPDREGDGKGRG